MSIQEPVPVSKAELFAGLPPEWPDPDLQARVAGAVRMSRRKVVVLDDDPTGSQTMQGVDVLTTWPVDRLREEMENGDPAFYVLTNSRSLQAEAAELLNAGIAANLARAARSSGVAFDLVSRSDSTLRGHYPGEVRVLCHTLQREMGVACDGHILIPFFAEGGRYTIGDVHWVSEATCSCRPRKPSTRAIRSLATALRTCGSG
jgi:uncharacterized protein YgbK (DUF1537 family)